MVRFRSLFFDDALGTRDLRPRFELLPPIRFPPCILKRCSTMWTEFEYIITRKYMVRISRTFNYFSSSITSITYVVDISPFVIVVRNLPTSATRWT